MEFNWVHRRRQDWWRCYSSTGVTDETISILVVGFSLWTQSSVCSKIQCTRRTWTRYLYCFIELESHYMYQQVYVTCDSKYRAGKLQFKLNLTVESFRTNNTTQWMHDNSSGATTSNIIGSNILTTVTAVLATNILDVYVHEISTTWCTCIFVSASQSHFTCLCVPRNVVHPCQADNCLKILSCCVSKLGM